MASQNQSNHLRYCLNNAKLLFHTNNLSEAILRQARRYGGGHSGVVPPQTKIVPPKLGLCPEEISRLGAIGVQIEA